MPKSIGKKIPRNCASTEPKDFMFYSTDERAPSYQIFAIIFPQQSSCPSGNDDDDSDCPLEPSLPLSAAVGIPYYLRENLPNPVAQFFLEILARNSVPLSSITFAVEIHPVKVR